jgi:hypothetical protein
MIPYWKAYLSLTPWSWHRFLPALPNSLSVMDFMLYHAYSYLIFGTYFWCFMQPQPETRGLFILAACFYGYFIKSANLFLFSIPAFILLPKMIIERNSKTAALCLLIMCCTMLGAKHYLPRPEWERLGIPGASDLWVTHGEGEALRKLVTYIDTPIYVCNFHNNGGRQGSDFMIYYLAHRLPTVYSWESFLGVTTRESIQRQIVAQLPATVIKVRYYENQFDPQGSNYLDDYIAAHYQPIKWFGNYLVMTRYGT